MIKPNFGNLEKKPKSNKKGGHSENNWREFLIASNNLNMHCSENIFEEELGDITISLNNWTSRKTYTKYTKFDLKKRKFIEQNVNIGDIFLVDFGFNYSPECSYLHPALVIEEVDNMVTVIPTSTNKTKLSAAYDFESKKGKWYYVKADKSNGFDDDCVLLLNNLKTISKGRLIDKKNSIDSGSIGEGTLFMKIKELMFTKYFPKQYINHLKINTELNDVKSQLEESNEKLETVIKENNQLKEELKALKEEMMSEQV